MSEIRIEEKKATVKIQGDIVSSAIDGLKSEFKETIENGITEILLDLSEVKYIDSLGIGLLVATHKSLMKSDSNLQLSNVSEDILKILNMLRLDQHFQIK